MARSLRRHHESLIIMIIIESRAMMIARRARETIRKREETSLQVGGKGGALCFCFGRGSSTECKSQCHSGPGDS
jgi:hypothetical protein